MADDAVTVRVQQGLVRGRRAQTDEGAAFCSFQGVPYAQPPVGALRFKVAQPVESWDGIRDALKEGPVCPQIDWILQNGFEGDEDCLYLNIYSPRLPSPNQEVKLPVMVWIHGGGFEVGSGNSEIYGPDYLVSEDVVLVTINYRVGIFGFLNLEDESVARNLGLKDQVAALRWLQKNIAVFGGDPGNVTLFGESAGGTSINYHLLSPMSKGLFHKAIMQSGCAINLHWNLAHKTQEGAFELARALGSSASSTQELLEFLSTAPARSLVEMYQEIRKKAVTEDMASPFRPSIETHASPGDEIFITAHPLELMQRQQFHHVPCMIGNNSAELLIILPRFNVLQQKENIKQIGENIEKFVSQKVSSKPDPKETIEKIKEFYFGNEPINEKHLPALVDLLSDVFLVKEVRDAAKYLSQGNIPVFYYNFDFSGKLNFYKHLINASDLPGASHLDEIGYLFATPYFKTPKVELDSLEWMTRRRMVKLWTNFAKTGDPTPDYDPILGIKWPCFTAQNAEYLDIGDSLKVKKNFLRERMEFWDSLA